MEAIFSSKLYKASRRKDKIASAIASPINVELVQQLRDYLGDEETEEQIVEQPLDVKPESDVPAEDEETFSEASGISAPVSRTSSTPAAPEVSEESDSTVPDEVAHVADPEPEVTEVVDAPAQDTSDVSDDQKFHTPRRKEKEDEDSVEESTSINAATTLYQPPVEASCCDKVRVDVAAIKGTLNVRDDTKGVSRIFVKDKELWIYYQDKINLNSVMEPVIEVLNGTGFTNLEFNRLARTENAIVFEISCVYEDVKPVVEVTE